MEIEKALMLLDCELVRHTSDKIADPSGCLYAFRPIAALLPFGRKLVWRAVQKGEEFAHDALRLAHRPVDPIVPVHALKEEGLEGRVVLRHFRREGGNGPVERPYLGGGGGLRCFQPALRFGKQVRNHDADELAHRLMRHTRLLKPRIAVHHAAENLTHKRKRHEVIDGKEPRPETIVDVMIVIGDVVRERGNLRFRPCKAAEFKVLRLGIFDDGAGQILCASARPDQRPIVLHKAFKRFPGEVQPVETGIALLEFRNDAKRLRIMIEAAEVLHACIERRFTRMAEGRVAEVVSERERFGEIFVETQHTRDGARDLRHFERMGKPRPVIVALVIDKNLRLVFETAEGARMDDPVPVPLKGRSRGAFLFLEKAASALRGPGGVGSSRGGIGDRHENPRFHMVLASYRFENRTSSAYIFARINSVSLKAERTKSDGSLGIDMTDSATIEPAATETPVTLTERAAKQIAKILEGEDKGTVLRVSVQGGGCSGFQYGFTLDDTKTDDDLVIERNGVRVLIDSVSVSYLAGSEIDYVDELIGSSFKINNPNATASCGCGTSFSI